MIDNKTELGDNNSPTKDEPFWKEFGYTSAEWAIRMHMDMKDTEMWQNSPWEKEVGEIPTTDFN